MEVIEKYFNNNKLLRKLSLQYIRNEEIIGSFEDYRISVYPEVNEKNVFHLIEKNTGKHKLIKIYDDLFYERKNIDLELQDNLNIWLNKKNKDYKNLTNAELIIRKIKLINKEKK